MKTLAFIGLITLGLSSQAQNYIGEKCSIKFFSAAKLENIDAENKVTKPILNIEKNLFAIQPQHTGFMFKSALMQEHYNENYMESEKFPYAKFTGKIKETIDYTKNGTNEISIEGKLAMHGVELPRTITGTLTIKDGVIIMDSKFDVKVADHNIKVPSLYVESIAEVIQVTFHTEMTAMKK